MKRVLTLAVMVFGVGVYLLGTSLPAHAVATARVDLPGGASFTCADGAACDGQAGVPGVISWSLVSPGDGVSITNHFDQTKPFVGGAGVAEIDMNYTVTFGTAYVGGTVSMWFSDDGFTSPTGPVGWVSGIGGTGDPGSTAVFTTYLDNSNALFGMGTPLAASGPLGPGAFAFQSTNLGSSTASYSLTLRVDITHASNPSSANVNTGDANLTGVVPEPASLLLLGSGLAGLGLWGRKRLMARQG